MKILMTDSRNDRLLAHFYSRHLKEIPGVQLSSLDYVDKLGHLHESIFNRIAQRAFPHIFLKEINRDIIRSVESFKPDLLWIFKGMEIFPETLEYAKKRGVRLVNYNPDHPFFFAAPGSGNAYVKNSIPIYDLHLSYSRKILEDLRTSYQIKGQWLPFGFEISEPIFAFAASVPEIERACFVGCADDERYRVVQLLVKQGIPVDVYGPGWDKYFRGNGKQKVSAGIYNDGLWSVIRSYRLQLNIFRSQNLNSHNMRSFEIPGIGGIMLAPWSEEHISFFEPGQEAYFFRNDGDLIRLSAEILAMTPIQALEIRQAARLRSVKDGYSYAERSRQALGYFNQLFSNTTSNT
jgi:spore maturation protein CgeB